MSDLKQLKIRLPRNLKAFIETEAAANASSQNSEIVRCIRIAMAKTKTAPEGQFADHTPDAVRT